MLFALNLLQESLKAEKMLHQLRAQIFRLHGQRFQRALGVLFCTPKLKKRVELPVVQELLDDGVYLISPKYFFRQRAGEVTDVEQPRDELQLRQCHGCTK
jgi:hypothetical protein